MEAAAPVIMQLVSSLGASGVLAWYCWYVTSTTLPRLTAEFRDEIRLAREEARVAREEASRQINQLSAAIEKMVAHCMAMQSNANSKTQT